MGARERRQADALDRSWDALVERAADPNRPGQLDPTLADVPRRLTALDRASSRDGRAPAWSEVADQIEREAARRRAVAKPKWAVGLCPEPLRRLRPVADRSRRTPIRWWPVVEFVGAMALIVALLGLAMGWDLNRPNDDPTAQPTSIFGAAPETTESADPQPATARERPVCEPPAGSNEFPEFEVAPRWDQRGAANEAFVHVRTVVEFGDLVLIGGSGARGEGASAIQALDAKTGEERWYQWLDGFAGGAHFGGVRVMSIVATPKLIFAVTDTGLAVALEPTTGQIIWQAFVGADGAQAGRVELGLGDQGATVFVAYGGLEAGTYLRDIGLSIVDEAVLVTTNNPGGRVAALTAETGAPIWERDVTAEVVSRPSLLAFDPVSGEPLWQVGFAEPLAAPAVVGDGMVYVASGDETVAIDVADGAERWRSGVAGELPTTTSSEGVPGFEPSTTVPFAGDTLFLLKGTLFVAGTGMIAALDSSDGTAHWCAPVGGAYHLSVASGIAFAATPAGVFALNAATGLPLSVVWSWPIEGGMGVWELYPTASEGSVYIRDWKQVVAYDLNAVVEPSAGVAPLPNQSAAGGLGPVPTVTLKANPATRRP